MSMFVPGSHIKEKYESPFKPILHTNHAPSDADAQRIREFCVAPEKEIEKLESEISRLEAALDAVRQERDALRDTVAAHRALLSPIRQLSSEILQEIFAYCLLEIPVMHVSEAPLLLGRVCRNWRRIVYATADLWSAVHVVVPFMRHPEHRFRQLEALGQWLARSGDRPLRISLYADHTAGELEVGAFLDLIVPLSSRWELLAIFVSAGYFEQLEQSFAGISSLSRLRCFELSDRGARFHSDPLILDSPTNPLHLLELCTNLQRVSIHIFSDPHPRPHLPASIAANLQELDVNFYYMFNTDMGQLLSFIALCQNLRMLKIGAAFQLVPAFRSTGLITLPALEHLCIDMYDQIVGDADSLPCSALMFLDHLVTPRLLHFDLVNVLNVNPVSLSLMKLFTRSSCSVRTLSVHVIADKQDLRPLLPSLEYAADLRELTIQCMDSNMYGIEDTSTPHREHDAFLLGLAYSDKSTKYCPNLTHLTLAGWEGIDVDSLLILVRSRLKPPPGCSRLQTLDLRELLPPPRAADAFDLESAVTANPGFKAALDLVKELRLQGLTILLPEHYLQELPQFLSPWTGMSR